MKEEGLLVAIVGINNIGKTTQVGLLSKNLTHLGYKTHTQKYPVYNCEPTGPDINKYLREKNPENISASDFQLLCAENRRDFQPDLEKILLENHIVVVEMYTESGIAFGLGDGVSRDYLDYVNEDLLKPDLVVLLDGERFIESKEEQHHFEQDDSKVEKIRKIHLDLAKEFDWKIVDANQSIEKVQNNLIDLITESFKVEHV